jgi:hypothetical protein
MSFLPQDGRRGFLRRMLAAGAAPSVLPASRPSLAEASAASPSPARGSDDRAIWRRTLALVARPVLESLAANHLRATMPVECPTGKIEERRAVTHLEAMGRTMAGIAPWLELDARNDAEAGRFAEWARAGLEHATDPAAPDHLSFTAGRQCLVDAAFLAQGLLRAPKELWQPLSAVVRGRVAAAMASTRSIEPARNNWLMFSAMVEAFLAAVGAEWKPEPVEMALHAHEEWYKGDGAYGDGPHFHWDYYNSFVIHPFLIDVLAHVGRVSSRWLPLREVVEARARRYAAVQERLVGPDGTFPPLGRSLAYRCGAFHLLAQASLRGALSEDLRPAQVRGALTAVIRRTLEAPGTFDDRGWLQVGLAGHQPHLAEPYISTGSLYLCAVAFLPLGLPAESAFWTDPAAEWTARRAWAGADLPADHARPE